VDEADVQALFVGFSFFKADTSQAGLQSQLFSAFMVSSSVPAVISSSFSSVGCMILVLGLVHSWEKVG
jgi:ABC-type multidrug transport system permease subunit